MIKNNQISFKSRMKELFIDWLVILLYLVLLFAVAVAIYLLFFKRNSEDERGTIATYFFIDISYSDYFDYCLFELFKRWQYW